MKSFLVSLLPPPTFAILINGRKFIKLAPTVMKLGKHRKKTKKLHQNASSELVEKRKAKLQLQNTAAANGYKQQIY